MSRDGVTFGEWRIPESELEERFDTSGGPGGQHANKNATAVTLRVDLRATSLPDNVTERLIAKLGDPVVEVNAADSRSQWRNRALARQRLAGVLEGANKPTARRRRTKPTRASKTRRLDEKRRRSEIKKSRRSPDGW
ncbi:MAG: alternative ribosome rescue aminoacyl-tRNA hydrolase ArfB [Acidimicrobiia bacterium]